MPHRVRVLDIAAVTHNVRRLTVEKPDGYTFEPGQATEVSVDADGWRDEKRPFTFTALNDWDHLEFTIKIYPDHEGVTDRIGRLVAGDHLLIGDPWGTIAYKGRGIFIAGGAGVTPFIAILRQLDADGSLAGHTLMFSNATSDDIILHDEFAAMAGLATVFTITREETQGFEHGRIDRTMLERHVENFGQHFYVCGPDPMVDGLKQTLGALEARTESLVFEE